MGHQAKCCLLSGYETDSIKWRREGSPEVKPREMEPSMKLILCVVNVVSVFDRE